MVGSSRTVSCSSVEASCARRSCSSPRDWRVAPRSVFPFSKCTRRGSDRERIRATWYCRFDGETSSARSYSTTASSQFFFSSAARACLKALKLTHEETISAMPKTAVSFFNRSISSFRLSDARDSDWSLPERDALANVGRESDEADLGRLDAEAAQNELAFDHVAHAGVDDVAFARERGDRITRIAEHADELVVERWRNGRRGRRRNLRLRLADRADAVVVDVLLVRVGRGDAVVAEIRNAVVVLVGRRRRRLDRRRRRRGRRLVIREDVAVALVAAAVRFEQIEMHRLHADRKSTRLNSSHRT